jgi:flagellar FliL protein
VGWFFIGGDEESMDEMAAEVVEERRPALYHPLNPVFVVNLPPGGKAKMLQIGVQVMARDPALIAFIKHNDPMVRHNLLSLFGNQQDAVLRDRKGKEKLQVDVFKTINQILKDQKGPGEIEAVFFTSFVMQ